MVGAKLPGTGDKIELLKDKPDYELVKGDVGEIVVAYDPYGAGNEGDFEVYFQRIDTSLVLEQTDFKVL